MGCDSIKRTQEPEEAVAKKPNLLFVFADQMRGMAMGCAGNADVKTPNMDRLASEGVRLSHVFATSPVCSPNRAVMLSGTYPTTNLMLCNDMPLKPDVPSLGTIAKENGYRTGYVGKWHLDGVPRTKFTPPGPRRWGFDFWAAYNCTHAYFEPKYYRDGPDVIEVEGYEPVVQTDLALEFLEAQRGAKEPFCLVVSWGPPHDPYPQAPENYRKMYEPEALSLRANVQPEAPNRLAKGKECRRTIADYYAAVTALDEQLGRLLTWLDGSGRAEETLVVFTSDHGDMLWSNGWMKKQAPHEESISAPFVMRWPERFAGGRVCDVLTGGVDILPTLGALMGWEMPASVEGIDLSRALLGEEGAPSPESVFIANYTSADEAQMQDMPEWRGVRTRRYTYAEKPGREPWLLFDNQEDPFQMRNVVCEAAYEGAAADLKDVLGGWLERTKDPFSASPELMAHYGLSEAFREREEYMHGGRGKPTRKA